MLSNKETILDNLKLVTFPKEVLESIPALSNDKINEELSDDEDLDKKINNSQQNLIIFKKALYNTRIKREEAFERAQNGIINEYCYRDILIRQMGEYRKAKKIANDAINTENYENLNNLAVKEKDKLMNMYETYNRIRDDESLEIANDAILEESNAMHFMIFEMSKLLDTLIERSGDQGESVINEISQLLED